MLSLVLRTSLWERDLQNNNFMQHNTVGKDMCGAVAGHRLYGHERVCCALTAAGGAVNHSVTKRPMQSESKG